MVKDSFERTADALMAIGDPEGAIGPYRQALEIATELVEADHADVRMKVSKANVLSVLGQALAEAGELAEAQSRLKSARAMYDSLLGSGTEIVRIRDGLVSTLRRLSMVMHRGGHGQAAVAYAQEAIVAGGDRNPFVLRALALALELTGDHVGARGAAEEAMQMVRGTNLGPNTERLQRELRADLERFER